MSKRFILQTCVYDVFGSPEEELIAVQEQLELLRTEILTFDKTTLEPGQSPGAAIRSLFHQLTDISARYVKLVELVEAREYGDEGWSEEQD